MRFIITIGSLSLLGICFFSSLLSLYPILDRLRTIAIALKIINPKCSNDKIILSLTKLFKKITVLG